MKVRIIYKATANKGMVMNGLLQEGLPAKDGLIESPDYTGLLLAGDFPPQTGSVVLDELVKLALGDPHPAEALDAPLEDHDSL